MSPAQREIVKQHLVADNGDTMVFIGTSESDMKHVATILNRRCNRMAKRGGQPDQWRVVTSDTADLEFIRA